MSFTFIRTYVEGRLAVVDSDMVQWLDAFNTENIPENILDKSWHIQFLTATQTSFNNNCLRFSYPFTLSVFFKGYATPKDAVDTANLYAENILKELLRTTSRLNIAVVNSSRIINVVSTSFILVPLANSNDNVVKLSMDFLADIYFQDI